jgi:hypothetical protein
MIAADFEGDLSIPQLARRLAVSEAVIRRRVREGLILIRRLPGGTKAYVPRSELDRLIAESQPKRAGQPAEV